MKFSIAAMYKAHVELSEGFLCHFPTFLEISFVAIIFIDEKAPLTEKISQIAWIIAKIQQVDSTCAASSAPKSWINLFFFSHRKEKKL